MPEVTLHVRHEAGLHARPAGAFAKLAQQFEASVSVTNLTRESPAVDGKSVLQLFTAAVASGHEIRVTTEGPDADEAVAALAELVDSNFGE